MDELTASIKSADLSVALVDLAEGTVAAISPTWLAHLASPADVVLGRPAIDLVRSEYDKRRAARALASLRDGAIDVYVARRQFNAPLGAAPMSTVWVRSFELGGRQLAFVQAASEPDDISSPITRHFGQEPARMAIGAVDQGLTITAVSSDISRLLGVHPRDLVGRPLRSVVAPRDVPLLVSAAERHEGDAVGLRIHLRNKSGHWVPLCCLLTSFAGSPERCFMVAPAPDADAFTARVAELEHHLWSIAAIVEASGVLQHIGPVRDMTSLPQANSLTTRQWDILARLVRGERVPAIASDLHVSQSTVRHHLSAIFKRFGVHSQPELLRMFDRDPGTGP